MLGQRLDVPAQPVKLVYCYKDHADKPWWWAPHIDVFKYCISLGPHRLVPGSREFKARVEREVSRQQRLQQIYASSGPGNFLFICSYSV